MMMGKKYVYGVFLVKDWITVTGKVYFTEMDYVISK